MTNRSVTNRSVTQHAVTAPESHHPLDNKLLLGRYRVVRLLGEGGMGTVHLARVEGAEGFTRPVVVKRMRRELRTTDEGNRLFIREAKILSKMQHPSIVGISDFGVEDGAHLMVLEYVHGYSLHSWIDYRYALQRLLPVDVCLFVVRRILDALHYAHHFDTEEGQEVEIVHRDVSPDNVLISNRGYVHLLDFGVASMRGPLADKSTQEGAFRGKLGYAAPETVQGQPATPRSDQYSAAVVLLEMLTHEMPFLAESMGETVVRMVETIPDPPSTKRNDIPPGLDEALARALAKSPEDRFGSALAFSRALRNLQKTDDDDIAQHIQSLVRQDFQVLPQKIEIEDLKSRDEALARIFSTPPGTPPAAPAGTVDANASVDPAPRAARAEAPPAALQSAPARAPSQLRGLLWGLLIMGGLIALGLGAAVSFLARGGGASEVVVVGGERTALDLPESEPSPDRDSDPGAAPAPDRAAGDGESSRTADPAPTPDGLAVAPGSNDSGERAPAARPPPGGARVSEARAPAATDSGKSLQQRLARAVHRQGAAFQQCFTEHVRGGGQTSEAVLHFAVASGGGSGPVNVEPAALSTTPLGRCLATAAGRVRFPTLKDDVSFRVPVRARVSRSGEPE